MTKSRNTWYDRIGYYETAVVIRKLILKLDLSLASGHCTSQSGPHLHGREICRRWYLETDAPRPSVPQLIIPRAYLRYAARLRLSSGGRRPLEPTYAAARRWQRALHAERHRGPVAAPAEQNGRVDGSRCARLRRLDVRRSHVRTKRCDRAV